MPRDVQNIGDHFFSIVSLHRQSYLVFRVQLSPNRCLFHLPKVGLISWLIASLSDFRLVIVPPIPSSVIPQPTLLEEPPIPVGLRAELETAQQQPYPSISLVLPKNAASSQAEAAEKQKNALALSSADDASATLSQQEELSVKGSFLFL